MRKISVKIGVTVLFALALVGFSISQAYAQKQRPKVKDELTVECDKGASIQEAVDSVLPGNPTTIVITGTCTEIVTMALVGGITILGDPVVGGTLLGGIIVNGVQGVVIDDLTIDGSTNTDPTIRLDGVRATNNADVTVRNSTIKNHTRDGVAIVLSSNGFVEGSTIMNNGRYGVLASQNSVVNLRDNPRIQSDVFDEPRTLLEPFTSTTIGGFNNSHLRLLGGNLIVNDGGGLAVEVFHSSSLRVQFSLNTIEGSRAISIGNGSSADLRGEFVVTGRVQVSINSTLRLRQRFVKGGV